MRSDVSRTMWSRALPVFAFGYAGHHASTFGLLVAAPREARRAHRGGARRDRTDDLMLAKHALSQLSYGPVTTPNNCARLRRSGFAGHASLYCLAWLRHAQPKAKRGGPGKT